MRECSIVGKNFRIHWIPIRHFYGVQLLNKSFSRFPSNKNEEFSHILQPWWLSLKNFGGISRESFPVTDSSKIFKKFPRIGPQDERFLWDHSFETQFREIPEKFLRLGQQLYVIFYQLFSQSLFKPSFFTII